MHAQVGCEFVGLFKRAKEGGGHVSVPSIPDTTSYLTEEASVVVKVRKHRHVMGLR